MVTVRDAWPDDTAEVAGVHVRSWQVGYRGLLPDEYLDSLRPHERAARYDLGATGPGLPSTIVAVADGSVRGFATTGAARDPDVAGAGEVLALYVDPPAWGSGVGRRLMAEARARLGARGHRRAVLWVMVGNVRAQRFYDRDRWAPDGLRRTDEVWGTAVDEVRYRRPLP